MSIPDPALLMACISSRLVWRLFRKPIQDKQPRKPTYLSLLHTVLYTKCFFYYHSTDSPLTVLTWLLLMPSQSISISERRKFASDIIPLADCQLISLCPRSTRIHSQTTCTCFGGLAKDLFRNRGGKANKSGFIVF